MIGSLNQAGNNLFNVFNNLVSSLPNSPFIPNSPANLNSFNEWGNNIFNNSPINMFDSINLNRLDEYENKTNRTSENELLNVSKQETDFSVGTPPSSSVGTDEIKEDVQTKLGFNDKSLKLDENVEKTEFLFEQIVKKFEELKNNNLAEKVDSIFNSSPFGFSLVRSTEPSPFGSINLGQADFFPNNLDLSLNNLDLSLSLGSLSSDKNNNGDYTAHLEKPLTTVDRFLQPNIESGNTTFGEAKSKAKKTKKQLEDTLQKVDNSFQPQVFLRQENLTPSTIREYISNKVCPICLSKYTAKGKLKLHVVDKHPNDLKIEDYFPKKRTTQGKALICPFKDCPSGFDSKGTLKRHIIIKHKISDPNQANAIIRSQKVNLGS